MTAASGTSGGATGTSLGSGNAGGAAAGSGFSGASNAGSANSGHSGHGTAGGSSFVAQLTSGSPVHLPATHDSVPLSVAIGLLLVGGIALGPARRRQFAQLAHTPRHPRGAHFTRTH